MLAFGSGGGANFSLCARRDLGDPVYERAGGARVIRYAGARSATDGGVWNVVGVPRRKKEKKKVFLYFPQWEGRFWQSFGLMG